jgi:hypothetical protein
MVTIGSPFNINENHGTSMVGTRPKFEETLPPLDVLERNVNHDNSYYPLSLYTNNEHKVWKRTASAYVVRDDDDSSTYEKMSLSEIEINGKTFCIDKSLLKFSPWTCKSCKCDLQREHCYTSWYLTKTTLLEWPYIVAFIGGIYMFSTLFF